jgi:DNA (cytosine-5)-methyltransferase 1
MLKVIELFGGIGAPRKALINQGIDHKIIDYVEVDEKVANAYNVLYERYPTVHKPQSVVDYNLTADILFHGSPCQDFSAAGKQKGGEVDSGTRSALMWETTRIVEEMGSRKPKVVIWENVRNALNKNMKPNFERYLAEMERLGYTNSHSILNSRDFGIPQNRDRIFVISILSGEKFDFSKLKRRPMKPLEDFLETEFDEKYIVTTPSMRKKIDPNDEKKGEFRVKVIKDCTWTITTRQISCPNSGVLDIGDGEYRILTEKECWRLMGFSDEDFEAVLKVHPGRSGTLNGAMYKLAGNSIVVDVLEAIFKELLKTEVVV